MSIDGFNPYDVLGIGFGSTEKEVRFAGLKLIKKHHPDKGGKDDDNLKKIIEAKKILETPEYKACFQKCFGTASDLARCWESYKKLQNKQIQKDPERGSFSNENEANAYDYDSDCDGYHKGNSSHNDHQESNDSRDYGERFHNYYHRYDRKRHRSNNSRGHHSKNKDFYNGYFSSSTQERRRSTRNRHQYESQRKREYQQEELRNKRKQEHAQKFGQSRENWFYEEENRYKREGNRNGNFAEWAEEELKKRRKPDFDDQYSYSKYGDSTYTKKTFLDNSSEEENEQPTYNNGRKYSYSHCEVDEDEVIDLTEDNDVDFSNVEVHDYSQYPKEALETNSSVYVNLENSGSKCNFTESSQKPNNEQHVPPIFENNDYINLDINMDEIHQSSLHEDQVNSETPVNDFPISDANVDIDEINKSKLHENPLDYEKQWENGFTNLNSNENAKESNKLHLHEDSMKCEAQLDNEYVNLSSHVNKIHQSRLHEDLLECEGEWNTTTNAKKENIDRKRKDPVDYDCLNEIKVSPIYQEPVDCKSTTPVNVQKENTLDKTSVAKNLGFFKDEEFYNELIFGEKEQEAFCKKDLGNSYDSVLNVESVNENNVDFSSAHVQDLFSTEDSVNDKSINEQCKSIPNTDECSEDLVNAGIKDINSSGSRKDSKIVTEHFNKNTQKNPKKPGKKVLNKCNSTVSSSFKVLNSDSTNRVHLKSVNQSKNQTTINKGCKSKESVTLQPGASKSSNSRKIVFDTSFHNLNPNMLEELLNYKF